MLQVLQESPRLNQLNGEPQVRQPLLVATVTIAMTVRNVSLFMASFSGKGWLCGVGEVEGQATLHHVL